SEAARAAADSRRAGSPLCGSPSSAVPLHASRWRHAVGPASRHGSAGVSSRRPQPAGHLMKRLSVGLLLVVAALSPVFAAPVDGLPLHYRAHRAGPAALVFVQGWACDVSCWAAQIEPFAERYRVVTVDLPGPGQSGAPAADAFSID